GIFDQSDERRAVGIIFQPLDLGRRVELAALEVDDAIGLLMTAAAKPHGDAAGIVAAALFRLALGQRLQRLALMELAAVDHHQLAKARRARLVRLESHDRYLQSPVVTSMRSPSASVTIAFFTSCCTPRMPRKTLVLPLRSRV